VADSRYGHVWRERGHRHGTGNQGAALCFVGRLRGPGPVRGSEDRDNGRRATQPDPPELPDGSFRDDALQITQEWSAPDVVRSEVYCATKAGIIVFARGLPSPVT